MHTQYVLTIDGRHLHEINTDQISAFHQAGTPQHTMFYLETGRVAVIGEATKLINRGADQYERLARPIQVITTGYREQMPQETMQKHCVLFIARYFGSHGAQGSNMIGQYVELIASY